MKDLREQYDAQRFANGYALVDGVAMHAENGDRFGIPPDVLKKHVSAGHFVELRINSSRFSAHPDAPDNCTCPHCNEDASSPILSHEQPASLINIPPQKVPSRGWGEDFWVQVTARDGEYFQGVVDNPLYEARLHELHSGDAVCFHSNHILAVHSIHRAAMVFGMNAADLKALATWLGTQRK